jgi:uncharacterized protein (DUF3820 family)
MRAQSATPRTCEPDKILSEAVQQRIGWDYRHDAIVRLILDEYALVLPRDRELVRQLAFIRVAQGEAHVMPFGKHKGKLLEEILVDDPNYIEWLAEQVWFRSEFAALYAVIADFNAEMEAESQP